MKLIRSLLCGVAASVSLSAIAHAQTTGAAINIANQAQTSATLANARNTFLNFNTDCGIFPGRSPSVDDTPVLTACAVKAAATGRAVYISPGAPIYANFIDIYPGVNFEGPGWGAASGKNPPSLNSIRPYNPSLPAWTMGDNTTLYTGMLVRDLTFDCYTVPNDPVCFKVSNGNFKNTIEHVQVYGRGGTAMQFAGDLTGTSTVVSAKNHVNDVHLNVSGVGFFALDLNDPQSTPTVFNNDSQFTNISITTSGGAIPIHNDSSTAQIAALKIDTGGEVAIQIAKTSSSATPYIYCSGCSLDSSSSYDPLVEYVGAGDFSALSNFPAYMFFGGSAVDGTAIADTNSTTLASSVSIGGSSLSLTSATGAAVGKMIIVRGASTWWAYITSISGTTVTFSNPTNGTTAPVANASGATVVIGWDEQGVKGVALPALNLAGAGFYPLDKYSFDLPLLGASIGWSRPSHAIGNVGAGDLASWYASNADHHMGRVASGVSISGATRSGTTITFTVASTGNIAAYDSVRVYGFNEAGFNGTYVLAAAAIASSTTFTVTSSVSGTATATGTGTFDDWRDTWNQGGNLWMNGLGGLHVKNQYTGDTKIISACGGVLKDTCFGSYGGTGGSGKAIMQYGHGLDVGGGGGVSLVAAGQDASTFAIDAWSITGNGLLQLGAVAANAGPVAITGLYMADAATNPSGADLSTNGLVSINAGRPIFSTGTTVRANMPIRVGVPATAASTCSVGDVAWSSSFFYWCAAANTWVRVAGTTF